MNRLARETSPYLLQHRDNPVDWYPWGDEAFEAARREDKPILLSVGYSTCHWCHVMAHESFEDEATARFMNAHFVNVKVDREERPDVDGVYMTAVQGVTGSGGWPMTVFLDPDGRPFYAGTYFPPQDRYGMPGFPRLLAGIAAAWRERRDELLQNAESITAFVREQTASPRPDDDLPADLAGRGLANIRRVYDARFGGFGGAPKFPSPTLLDALLLTPGGRDMALGTLARMAAGGLRDQLGGGFHRYSVDETWTVPHFEKMLYDNAALATAYLHAFQASGDGAHAEVARDTLAYLAREMLAPEGGFLSAQDADSEGIEGKFFVWTPQEFRKALGDDADLALRLYGVAEPGNFQDPHHPDFGRRSVLRNDTPEIADAETRARIRARLFEVREARVHPGTDDKVLASWNGLALGAFALGARVLGDDALLDVARRNAEFAWAHLRAPDGGLFHVYKHSHTSKDGRARVTGLLEDPALYGLGLVELYKATGDLRWIAWARDLWTFVRAEFWDEAAGAFWSTARHAETLIARRQDVFDAAVMSDNAAACLLGLWIDRYFGEEHGERIARRVLRGLSRELLAAPTGFGGLWQVLAFLDAPHVEVALLGTPNERRPFERELAWRFLPFAVVAPAERGEGLPVLEGRGGNGAAYVCRNFACELPARTLDVFSSQLAGVETGAR